jgi:hypothetical protein
MATKNSSLKIKSIGEKIGIIRKFDERYRGH